MSQISFSQAEYAGKKKQTRRASFWPRWSSGAVGAARLIGRSTRRASAAGRRLESMLRLYFLQQWYGLADEALEDALYDSQALRGFAGIDLWRAGSGGDDGAELPPLAGAQRPDQGDLRSGDAGGARPADARAPSSMPRSSPPRPRPRTSEGARPGDAPDQEGQPVALRDEGAYRGGCRLGGGAHGHRHRRQRSRHQSDGGPAARPGGGGLRRCRLYRSGQAAGT